MFKRAMLMCLTVLLLPAFANATVYWQITKSSTPTSYATSVAAPVEAGFYSTTGNITNVTSAARTYADFTVGAPANYAVSSVKVDGVIVGSTAGTYRINKGTSYLSHTIAVSYIAGQITLTPSAGTGGTIAPASVQTVAPGTDKTFTVYASKGYKINTVTKNGGAVTLASQVTDAAGNLVSGTYTFSNIQASDTLTATFSVLPNVSAIIATPSQTVATGAVVSIDGTPSSSNVTPTTYDWAGTGAAYLSTTTGKSTVFTAPATAGSYTVTLTATQASVTPNPSASITFTVLSPKQAASSSCIDCHKGQSDAMLTLTQNYQASMHVTGASCSDCHNGGHPFNVAAASTACASCHSTIISGYNGSRHATSVTGNTVPDIVNHGTNCTQTCHFQTANAPGCATCHSGSLTPTGTLNAAPSHLLINTTAAQTCMVCHEGDRHGLPTANWEKSTHNIANQPVYIQENVSCVECHDPHNTIATATDGKTDSCSKCHVYRDAANNFSIYTDATYATLKAPHGGGVATSSAGGNGTTQYLTQGAICTDCHGHNNTINAGFAEGGHGAVSNDPLNAWGHYDWSGKTNNGTRQNGNCDRCHTAGGFLKLLGDTATATRLAPVSGQPNNVLVCIACHAAPSYTGSGVQNMGGVGGALLPEGKLRIDATPAGNPTPLTGGYFALFSSASPTAAGTQGQVAADKTKITIAFPGYKNSSICVPCHSGRSTAAVFVAVIDQAKAVNKNYTTIGTSYYQHAANMGQTFISQGGYDLTGKLASIAVSAHNGVKMGAADSQGPCVGCHYSTEATHSLEVNANSPTCIAAGCHTTAPDLVNAKASFDAGVKALDTLIRAKFAPLQTKVQGTALEEERANVRFGRFGKADGVPADAATAKAAYGAWYNWQILATYDNAAWAHNPRYARQILNDTLAYVNLGIVKSYRSSDVTAAIAAAQAVATNPITAAEATQATAFIVAPGCAACHAAKVTSYMASYHGAQQSRACVSCHSENHDVTNAVAKPTCSCHGDNATTHPVLDTLKAAGANCAKCHGSTDVHSMVAADATKECLDCHDVAIKAHNGKVNDNDGIRAIKGEFQKRSHHIINADGSLPTSAQCSVCHLEGKTDGNGKAVVDTTYHMKDSNIYLRDVDNAAGKFVWNGTDHTAMDNFCFACHDIDGANDIATIQAFLPAATKANPFADSLKNGYDQVTRAGVIDVKTAFTTTNASHHAVSGQRYKYRFSTLVNAQTWAARTGNQVPGNDQIAEFHIGEISPNGDVIEAFDAEEPMTGDFTLGALAPGEGDATLFEAGKFVTAYTPLGASESVADNSTLHCGDCHTVGQWKANTGDQFNKVAIGAHGSNNEYLLRNNTGNDVLHNNNTYVCFNCHVAGFRAGATHPLTNKNQVLGYATAHAVSAFHIQCLADSADNIGATDRLARSWEADKTHAPIAEGGDNVANPSDANWGNITGIACTNCHNSGLRSGFGGIHGGDNTYTDGLGRSQKTYRFMPGMGNYKYAPPGGWDGKDVSDPRFVVQNDAAVVGLRGKPLGGCYTNSATGDTNPGYSSCSHHGTSTVATYGGGTSTNANTSTATNWEPTVREATAGNSLVTRPLKY